MVVLFPDPGVVTPPGLRVNVQLPAGGKPPNTTLPVASKQDGWVIIPTEGGVGVTGWALITTLPEGEEVHPGALVTVKV